MCKPQYTQDSVYKILETLCASAGVRVRYTSVPDDPIKGELWARADEQARVIEMPEEDIFESPMHAALVLGHELAHIAAQIDSTDDPAEGIAREAMCDMLGAFLCKLAEMIAMEDAESVWKQQKEQ